MMMVCFGGLGMRNASGSQSTVSIVTVVIEMAAGSAELASPLAYSEPPAQ